MAEPKDKSGQMPQPIDPAEHYEYEMVERDREIVPIIRRRTDPAKPAR